MSRLVYGFVSVLLINLGLVHESLTQVAFRITQSTDQQNYECSTLVGSVSVKENETLTVNVTGEYFNEIHCSTSSTPFLTRFDFKQRDQDPQNLATAEITKPTAAHNGKWHCSFYFKTQNRNNIRVDCTVQVNVIVPVKNNDSDKGPFGLDNKTFMIILGGVGILGAIVIIIIIVQTIIIINFKKKVAQRTLSHLEQRPPLRRDDRSRYSTLPLRRKRETTSCIYQSLENLRSVDSTPPDIKNRPQMPLPRYVDTDDEDSIYNAMLEEKLANLKRNGKQRGKRGGRTLSRIFTPDPPSLDTLPRRGKSKNSKPKPALPIPAPKPAKPMQTNLDDMESYDYAGSEGGSTISRSNHARTPPSKTNMRDDIPMTKGNPRPVPPKPVAAKPVPPKPCVTAGPGLGGAPVMNELGNILKKRNDLNARAAEPPHFEDAAPHNHHQPMRPAPREYPPQQTRAPGFRGQPDREIRTPMTAWQPPSKPFHHPEQPAAWGQEPRPQVPRYQDHDRRPSETSRYPQEERPPPESPRYPREDRKPSAGHILRNPNMRMVETRGPPYRQLSPEMSRAPPPMISPSQMRSPPLPRKPNSGGIRSPIGKQPAPPPPDTDSYYEPIEDADSTDDEEWKTEELKDYHIYNQ